MRRRFQCNLKWLFLLTLIASLGAEYARYLRIASAEEEATFHEKVVKRMIWFERNHCYVNLEDRIREHRAKLQNVRKRLKELRGY